MIILTRFLHTQIVQSFMVTKTVIITAEVPPPTIVMARNNNGNRMNREQLRDIKDNSLCSRCGKFGHWNNEHDKDEGSLRKYNNSF